MEETAIVVTREWSNRWCGAGDRACHPVSALGALVTITCVLLSLIPAAAQATLSSFTWSGRSPLNAAQWSLGTNWSTSVAPMSGEGIATLSFPELTSPGCELGNENEACYTSVNDLAGLSAESLQLDDGDDYLIAGDELSLGTGGLTASPPSHSAGPAGSFMIMPLQLSASQRWSIADRSGAQLDENGLAVAGDVTGVGSALTVELSNGTAFVLANHTEVGPMTVEGPSLTGEHIDNGSVFFEEGQLNSAGQQPVSLDRVFFSGTGALGPLTTQAATVVVGSGTAPAKSLQASSVKLDSASGVVFEVRGTGTAAQTDYSQLTSAGPVDLAGVIGVVTGRPSSKGTCPVLSPGETLTLVSTTGTLAGSFANAPEGGPEIPIGSEPSCPGSQTMRISYHRSGGVETVTGTVEAAAKEEQEARENREAKERREAQEQREAQEAKEAAEKEKQRKLAEEHAKQVAEEAAKSSSSSSSTPAPSAPAPIPAQGVAAFHESVIPPVPNARLAGTALTASPSGTVSVKMACPVGETTCSGTIALRTLSVVSAGVKGKGAILTLASGSFDLAGGKVETVKLRLSAKARALLARLHVMRARATIVARDPAGATHMTQALVTLRVAKPTHGKP
jgi:hypothetical protein